MSKSPLVPALGNRLRKKPRIGQPFWVFTLALTAVPALPAQGPLARAEGPAAAKGLAIVERAGYPELRVDGVPFFLHSAAFFYDRIPRDLWARLLERYRQLGINCIDIYIPWNWHEPQEGEFDFDGHTNPRRDLRSLLRLISGKGFKLVARPGPQILNEWRHGGYPGWLLERPEYKMDAVDRLEGRYPPLSYLNTSDAEAAAKAWLENPTHLAYARKWLMAVGKELAPYSSHRVVHLLAAEDGGPKDGAKDVGGPLLFVQLEDDMAIGRTNTVGPFFWRYMETLRGMLEAGGLDASFFINPTDMRVSAAGAGLPQPIAVMGQWYMPPHNEAETGIRELNTQDASTIEFFVEELKTQPAFPPILIEYQAGWYCPGDDDRPLESPPENTLLSSRLLLSNGLHGINYFPLQDTYTPAGYSVPWANRAYRWDAALSPDGNAQPRAQAVARNGQLLERWGALLAASHKRADFGIVYPMGAYPQGLLKPEDILGVSQTVMRLERLGQIARLSSELLDPEYQPPEQLLRDAVLLLPVFDPAQPKFQLSKKAQRALVEYVRRGGTLVYFPARPAGEIFEELWKALRSAPSPAVPPLVSSALPARWDFGAGQVIGSTKDFYSWIALDREVSENIARPEAENSAEVMRGFLNAAGVRPVVKRSGTRPESLELFLTEIVSDEGTGLLGARKGGQGLLSVTNLDGDKPAEEDLTILSPRASARGAPRAAAGDDYIRLRVTVPPRESLLLPLREPLCSDGTPYETCQDQVVAAGAELLRMEREGKTLELTFYTPAGAEILLRLERAPARVSLEETKPEANWDPGRQQLRVVIPRGASPGFLRVLKVNLPYTPHVPEKPAPQKNVPNSFDYRVIGAVRLPFGEESSLASFPPLVALDAAHLGDLRFELRNNTTEQASGINIKVEGPLQGSARQWLLPGKYGLVKLKLKTASGRESLGEDLRPSPDGLVHGTLEVRAGHDRRNTPIDFVVVRAGAVSRYRFDFDRDAANEWVLENTGLRLIVSPEAGGRALALTDKVSHLNLVTSVGALRDHFAYAERPFGTLPERARGRYGLFNRNYEADWLNEQGIPVLRLSYDAPDILPSGALIEKTVRLASPEEVRVDYRIQLHGEAIPGAAGSRGAAPNQPAQAFVAVNSVPAISRGNLSTRFCWPGSATEAYPLQARPADARGAMPGERCKDFTPGGTPLVLPEAVKRLEIRTPGRPSLALEWETGRMTIEKRNFSALLRLEFPPLTPGGDPGKYFVRFRVLAGEDRAAE